MEEHRDNPVCASCHKLMDPLGFALENFDAVGRLADARRRQPDRRVRASSSTATKMDGVVGLRQALVERPDIFVGTLTEKLLTYALGRGLDYYDMPAVRQIVRDVGGQDYRFSSLVLGIVNSTPFQIRVKPRQQDDELWPWRRRSR